MRNQLAEEYSLCSSDSIANATLEQFTAAMSAVTSRCYSYMAASDDRAPSGSRPVVLVPLADMQNHEEDGNTHWKVGEEYLSQYPPLPVSPAKTNPPIRSPLANPALPTWYGLLSIRPLTFSLPSSAPI